MNLEKLFYVHRVAFLQTTIRIYLFENTRAGFISF